MKKPRKSPEFTLYHLDASFDGQHLGSALRKLLGGASWNQVRKLIQQRKVQVNGNLCLDDARRVGQKDVLKIWNESLAKPVSAEDLRIVHLDEHLLVVEKPAAVTSVRHFEERRLTPKRRQLQPTLDELLPEVIAKMHRTKFEPKRAEPRSGDPPKRASRFLKQPPPTDPSRFKIFPVHRLDRDTSGLMLFARDRATAIALTRMFKNHSIDRRYLAVAEGRVPEGTYRSFLARDRGDGLRGSVEDPNHPLAQLAVTHVRPVEILGHYTVVECRLETGRTHQIRIHLSEAGHPLLGERLYRKKRGNSGGRSSDRFTYDTPRHALHAYFLRFEHPSTKRSMEFVSAWPQDLARVIAKLRSGQDAG